MYSLQSTGEGFLYIILGRCYNAELVLRTNRRTDRHVSKSSVLSSWSRIYLSIHVHIYLDYFSNFSPLWPTLVYLLFSHIENRYKYHNLNQIRYSALHCRVHTIFYIFVFCERSVHKMYILEHIQNHTSSHVLKCSLLALFLDGL